ncbi:hypothetical protein DU504_09415 [Haloplanus salinus]|uniref:Uncharacterized protein n=1 Tax=Haloplanus salinus TaxID=1126245 RepID=A0A368NBA5_9EURY|nr:hypothetical protein [Haloplanus salinus]RCU47496.1 hypothetical protein DU504_09415 [Haloplanus salinus]
MSQRSPLANPVVRHAVGATGAIAVVAVAYLFLDGTVQLAAYAIAALDLVVTPQILKRAATG